MHRVQAQEAKPGVQLRSPRQRAIFNLVVAQYEGVVQKKLYQLLKEYAAFYNKKKAQQAQKTLMEILKLYQHLAMRRTQMSVMSKLFEITTPQEYQSALHKVLQDTPKDELIKLITEDPDGGKMKAFIKQKLEPILQQYDIKPVAGDDELVAELAHAAANIIAERTGLKLNRPPVSDEERDSYVRARMMRRHPMVDVAGGIVTKGDQGLRWVEEYSKFISDRVADIMKSHGKEPYFLTKDQLVRMWNSERLGIIKCDHKIGCGGTDNHPENCRYRQNMLSAKSWSVLAKAAIDQQSIEKKQGPQAPKAPQAPQAPQAPKAPQATQSTAPPAAAPPKPKPSGLDDPDFVPKKGSIDNILPTRVSKPWYRRA